MNSIVNAPMQLNEISKSLNTSCGITSGNGGIDRSNVVQMFIHNLKNPVFCAKGFLKRLFSDKESSLFNEKQLNYLEVIRESLDRVETMIKQINEFMRIDEHEYKLAYKPININEPLIKSIEDIKLLAEEKDMKIFFNHTISLEGVSYVYADPVLIRQVITSLLDNAIKYSDAGASVTIRLFENDKDVLFQIIDTGRGIPDRHLPYIFKPFYRATASPNGTGLGLFFVKKIIEAHGGRVWVESKQDSGSIFSFTLPKKGKADRVQDTGQEPVSFISNV